MSFNSVIDVHIDKIGKDYRREDAPAHIPSLSQRDTDKITLGRVKDCKSL